MRGSKLLIQGWTRAKTKQLKFLSRIKKVLKLIFREIRQEVKRISQENMIEDLNCRARSLDHS